MSARDRVATGTPLLVAILCLSLLAGCVGWRTTSGGPPDYDAWRARDAQLATLDRWRLNGTIAVSGSATREAIGRLGWRQTGPDFHLNLRGPFGAGAIAIDGNPDGVTVRDKNQRRHYNDPAVALERAAGWPVPLDALREWIVGRPADLGIAELDINAQGQILHMRQRDWTVEFLAYQDVDGWQLPSRLTAEREGVSVKLIINDWQLSGARATGDGSAWPAPPSADDWPRAPDAGTSTRDR